MQQVMPIADGREGFGEGGSKAGSSNYLSDEFAISRTKSLEVLIPPGMCNSCEDSVVGRRTTLAEEKNTPSPIMFDIICIAWITAWKGRQTAK